MTDTEAYPDNVLWEESPHGYYYNDGNPEKIRKLQAYMVERGFVPPVVLCHEHNGCIYYTAKDPSWTDTLIGVEIK